MSFIQIMDLHHRNSNLLNTLNTTESKMVVGGSGSPAPTIAKIAAYNTAYSLSIANLNKVNILTVGSGANFDASFTVDGQNSKRVVSGSIGYNAQLSSRYAKITYSK